MERIESQNASIDRIEARQLQLEERLGVLDRRGDHSEQANAKAVQSAHQEARAQAVRMQEWLQSAVSSHRKHVDKAMKEVHGKLSTDMAILSAKVDASR